jgi:D-alanyl-lipoteichoic acid acyltransferase DltB (MBOAT superfamily)
VLFNSTIFLVFAVVVIGAHGLLRGRSRTWLLLAASYVFYGAWDVRFLSLILLSTAVDFTIAQRLMTTEEPLARRRLLRWSIAVNLGTLGIFKYLGFFVAEAVPLFSSLGLSPDERLLSIALPVGISFYTFQTMSYTVDVYRRKIDAEQDLLTFALFVAYFPQLVAGPIERAGSLLPQLRRTERPITRAAVSSGLQLILLGYFKKVGLGDVLGGFADQAFDNPEQASGALTLLATYAFAFQIYCDFSGYSDIARGVSRLLGVDLIRNFEQPYLSQSITEFWRRWHISLSSWLRDYLYIPLGGNRKGPRRTYLNLMLTMLLGGLWHGAGWNFVIWGGLNGGLLALERVRGAGDDPVEWNVSGVLRAVMTFHLVCLCWIFFRAPTFSDASALLSNLASLTTSGVGADLVAFVAYSVVAVLVIDLLQRRSGVHGFTVALRTPAAAFSIALMLLGTISATGSPARDFIYFQF